MSPRNLAQFWQTVTPRFSYVRYMCVISIPVRVGPPQEAPDALGVVGLVDGGSRPRRRARPAVVERPLAAVPLLALAPAVRAVAVRALVAGAVPPRAGHALLLRDARRAPGLAEVELPALAGAAAVLRDAAEGGLALRAEVYPDAAGDVVEVHVPLDDAADVDDVDGLTQYIGREVPVLGARRDEHDLLDRVQLRVAPELPGHAGQRRAALGVVGLDLDRYAGHHEEVQPVAGGQDDLRQELHLQLRERLGDPGLELLLVGEAEGVALERDGQLAASHC